MVNRGQSVIIGGAPLVYGELPSETSGTLIEARYLHTFAFLSLYSDIKGLPLNQTSKAGHEHSLGKV